NDISNSNFYLGTCNDFPLAIGTNGIEKVRINTNGKVGIGTADPNYTLHVHSDELVSETPETLIFKSGSGKNIKADSQQSDIEAVDDELLKSDNLKTGVTASTGPTGTITFQMTNKTTGQGPDDGFQINLQNYNASINLKQPGNLFLKTSDGNIDMRAYGGNLLATAKEYRFMTSGTTLQHPALRIKNNGNIGIGVKDPIHNLQVNGNIAFQGQNSSLIFGQSFPTPTAEWGQWAIEYNRTTGGLNFWKPFNSNKFGNYYLFLSDNGNVLIGKSTQVNPIYKLDVEGAIRANEIVVNTTGADFVFENNYQLTSLVELEKSIRENKHLPGIPSATDMRKKGMPLGEMNTLLLQKIEEITLYLIDLQKDNDLLKDRLLKLEIK
ncbi:MAG: hypothetical protein NTV01_20365, partial [Bacteroidia bacterium]|nr:hypothetical protein [Bacteroidia bacterium]